MTDYTATTTVPYDVTDTFAFIRDPSNLPDYFPRMEKAEQIGPELVRTTAVVDADQDGENERVVSEVEFIVDESAHSITWKSPESAYHGSLTLQEVDGKTKVRLSISTVHDIPEVQQGLDAALQAIAGRLEAMSATDESDRTMSPARFWTGKKLPSA